MPAGNQRTAEVADLDGPGLTLSVNNQKVGRWGPSSIVSPSRSRKVVEPQLLHLQNGHDKDPRCRAIWGIEGDSGYKSALRFRNVVPTGDITFMTICSPGH